MHLQKPKKGVEPLTPALRKCHGEQRNARQFWGVRTHSSAPPSVSEFMMFRQVTWNYTTKWPALQGALLARRRIQMG